MNIGSVMVSAVFVAVSAVPWAHCGVAAHVPASQCAHPAGLARTASRAAAEMLQGWGQGQLSVRGTIIAGHPYTVSGFQLLPYGTRSTHLGRSRALSILVHTRTSR